MTLKRFAPSDIALGILVALAVIMTAFTFKRDLALASKASALTDRGETVVNWREYGLDGQRLGTDTATVLIVVFSDYQCVACQRLDSALGAIKGKGVKMEVSIRHFPMEGHSVAEEAARVALCAAAEGRFSEVHHALFMRQDQLETRPLVQIASDAGMRDTVALRHCMTSPATDSALMRDEVHAAALDVDATPTFLINDHRYMGVPKNLADLIRKEARR